VILGSDIHVECLRPLPDGGCLGHQFTLTWAILPCAVSDDGYVLVDRDGTAQRVDGASLGIELPAYSIPIGYRLVSFSLWIAIALFGVWAIRQRLRRARMRRDRRERLPETNDTRVLDGAGDRAIDDAIRPHLDAGEIITHQAYVADAMRRGYSYFAAVTNQRIVLQPARAALLRKPRAAPLQTIDRYAIESIHVVHERIVIDADGASVVLVVPWTRGGYSTANQRAFLRDVPILTRSRAKLPDARVISRA
jgi:hypothetical protein